MLSFKTFLLENELIMMNAEKYTNAALLKNYVAKINAYFGSDIISVYSRDGSLKSITGSISGGKEAIELVMKNVFGKTTKIEQLSGDVAKSVSGKFDSFLVKLSTGGGFYFRSKIGVKGVLHDKDLTPAKLHLTGKKLTKVNFDDEFNQGVTNSAYDLPINMLDLMQQLLLAVSVKSDTIPINTNVKDLMGVLTSTELQIFGKNFGEIALAKWCLYNKPKAKHVFFPIEENAALADFLVTLSTDEVLKISAKFESGANASINSIISKGSVAPKGFTPEENNKFSAIMAVVEQPILKGLIMAEEILDTPEYKAIKKMCKGGIVNEKTIGDVVEKALMDSGIPKNSPSSSITKEKISKFRKIMDPLYSKIKTDSQGFPKDVSFSKIAAGKFADPVLYAFSVALAARFNADETYTKILNKAAQAIEAEQIYLKFTPTNITVTKKIFAESEFIFISGAMTHDADNVRMKVQMLKK
jgi:hypothetical protein